jgi:UDP-glucose 4-epimerase
VAAEADQLTVAVTGPTGDIGRATIRALESADGVGRIVGMARRPFDPSEHGWERTEYRRGDILDRESVDGLVDDADVVVHLAFVIFGSHDETHSVNLEGTRNVFEAAVAAGAKRLVYTSSVAAYGFHADNPDVVTEDVETRGSDEFYYSAQKAELEKLLRETAGDSPTETYAFRPCVVAGPDAPTLIDSLTSGAGPAKPLGPVISALERLPLVRPVLPDTGVPFQLVHHDDVAAAIVAAVLGRGAPGIYNLAAPDELTYSDLAHALGWASVPAPKVAVTALSEIVRRAPLMPAEAQWIHAFRKPVLMDCSKAREELGWEPAYSGAETLAATVAHAREH